jgi:hypothetical protein
MPFNQFLIMKSQYHHGGRWSLRSAPSWSIDVPFSCATPCANQMFRRARNQEGIGNARRG